MLEDNGTFDSESTCNMSMPARGGLLPGIAISAPFKGSTAAYTSVRVVAVQLKGRNSHLALGDNLFEDARSSTGAQHQFHDIADSRPSTNHASQAVGLSDPQYITRRKCMFEFLTRLRLHWVRTSVNDPRY